MKKDKKFSKETPVKIFAIALSVLVLICGIALIIGYNVMMDYDKSQKMVVVKSEEIASDIMAGNYDVLESTGGASAIFEKEAYLESIKAAVEKCDEITVEKGFSTDRYNAPVYNLMAGSTKIVSLEYKLSEKKSTFGFDTFELSKAEPAVKGKYEADVYVPSDCKFYINEIEVPESFIVTEAEDKSGATYKVSGLVNEPELKVIRTESGEETTLVYDETLKALAPEKYAITITAPSNCKVYLNEKCISDDADCLLEDNIEIEAIAVSQNYAGTDICLKKYYVKNIDNISKAEIYGIAFDSSKVTAEKNGETGIYEIKAGIWPADLSKYNITEDYLIQRAKAYAKFVSNDGNRYDEVLPYVLPDSEIYKTFEEYWVTLSKHNSYRMENVSIDDISFYSDNLFSATVSLDYIITGFDHQTDNEKTYPTNITFFYTKSGDSWKICDWSLS